MSASSTCPTCRAAFAPTDRFCGSCGADLRATASPAKLPQRTMLGVSPLAPAAVADSAEPSPTAPQPPTPVASRAPAQNAQATMLGMAAQLPMAPPGGPAASAPAAAPAAVAPASKAQKPTPKSTMLGMAGAPKPAAKRGKAIPATSDRTILGMSAASAPGGAEAEEDAPADEDDEAALGLSRGSRASGLGRTLALIGGGLVLGVGALFALKPGAPALDVQIAHEAAGETLVVKLPDSSAARVRFAGSEQPVRAGTARFPLAADALKVGHNELALTVLGANGEQHESRVGIELDYRARLSLDALASDPPHAELWVEASPGARVTVEGKPLALDASGRGHAELPVEPVTSGSAELKARYRIEAEGKPAAEAQLETSLPAASLAVDAPSDGLKFEARELHVAGSAGSNVHVRVAGDDVPVQAGRFRATVQVPELGPFVLDVVARAPGQAPRRVTLHTERVASLALAAAAFAPDKSVTYAALAADPAAQRGKNVAFDARVYNVESQGGKGVLQVLASDCPKGQRCPLWVETGELEAARKDDDVRILGTVLGEQQFRSKQGAVQAVPSVRADFVLPRPKR